MKRYIKHVIALLGILAVPVVPMVVAAEPVAAATNCQFHATTIIWDGKLTYTPYADHCTDADAVDFHAPGAGYGGIWDITWGSFFSATNGGGTVNVSFLCNCTNTALTPPYRTSSWCGGLVHAVQPMYYVRVHSSLPPYAWGPSHPWNTAVARNINC